MQYAFLIYRDEKKLADLPADELARRMQAMQTILTETAEHGILGGAVRLEDVTQSKTVRHRNGTMSFCDGPFAETKEFLAGLVVIECESESEAAGWASRLTQSSCSATVEYRPVAGLYPAVQPVAPALAGNER